METRHLGIAACVAAGLVVTSCGSDTTGPTYDPAIPAAWAPSVTNPFFPLVPGTIRDYRAETEDGVETVTVEVLGQTKVINGVAATAVRDRAFLDGELIENTEDWFAQDPDGNCGIWAKPPRRPAAKRSGGEAQ